MLHKPKLTTFQSNHTSLKERESERKKERNKERKTASFVPPSPSRYIQHPALGTPLSQTIKPSNEDSEATEMRTLPQSNRGETSAGEGGGMRGVWSPGMSPSLGTSRQAAQRDPCSKRVLRTPWGWNCPGPVGRASSAEATPSVKMGSPRVCVVLLECSGLGWRAVSLRGAQSWCQATACLCSGGSRIHPADSGGLTVSPGHGQKRGLLS